MLRFAPGLSSGDGRLVAPKGFRYTYALFQRGKVFAPAAKTETFDCAMEERLMNLRGYAAQLMTWRIISE
jgi:hypothetical protein